MSILNQTTFDIFMANEPDYVAREGFKVYHDETVAQTWARLGINSSWYKKYAKIDGNGDVVEMTAQEKADNDAEILADAAQAAADLRDLVKQVPAPAVEAFKILLARQNAIVTVIKTVAPGPGAGLSTMTNAELLAAVDEALK